jgi:hypothetical protein
LRLVSFAINDDLLAIGLHIKNAGDEEKQEGNTHADSFAEAKKLSPVDNGSPFKK